MFHFSDLRKHLVSDDANVVDANVHVDYIKPPSPPHELEHILVLQEKKTCHMIRQLCLVKWEDRPKEGST